MKFNSSNVIMAKVGELDESKIRKQKRISRVNNSEEVSGNQRVKPTNPYGVKQLFLEFLDAIREFRSILAVHENRIIFKRFRTVFTVAQIIVGLQHVKTLEKVLSLKFSIKTTTILSIDSICVNVSKTSHSLFL